MNKLLILIFYTKFELNSLRNNEITDYRHFWTKQKSEMTSYLNSGYDVIHYFAKFKKFLPHSIIPSFMTVGSQMGTKSRFAFIRTVEIKGLYLQLKWSGTKLACTSDFTLPEYRSPKSGLVCVRRLRPSMKPRKSIF